ncbi:MAG TPA: DUF1302 family protein [Clostridia bacterium]|nr:DUF1302 family protein [Clostridia bacterium]
MKKYLKIFSIIALVFLVATTPSYAAESAFDSEETTSEFSSSFTDEKPLEFGGKLSYDIRSYLDKYDQYLKASPELDLNLFYEKDSSELNVKLDFTEDKIEIGEAYFRLYYDSFNFLIGKKKVVWGKGDKMHIVDNLNAFDYTDFVNPDYLDRKIAEEMIKLNYYMDSGSLEVVYTPDFTPHRLALDPANPWMRADLKRQQALIGELPKEQQDKLMNSLKYGGNEYGDGQLALRYTDSYQGYDYGFSFYQGRMREPSVDIKNIAINYDRVSIIGAELSTVLADINMKSELAYYRTKDTEGNDPALRNNRLAVIIGGDKNLPYNNLNINIQLQSNYIMANDKIKDTKIPGTGMPIDVDYRKNGEYLTNTLSLGLTDSYKRETILPELSLAYNTGDGDYMLGAKVDFVLKDDTTLSLNYKNFGGDNDTQFGQYDENDYFAAEIEYIF